MFFSEIVLQFSQASSSVKLCKLNQLTLIKYLDQYLFLKMNN
jgi:hypothetical protein